MSEALISKEHFYLNASQYNRTASDVTANIHVQDTQDILEQNADWLVHVTRFSCDNCVLREGHVGVLGDTRVGRRYVYQRDV